MEAYGYSDVKVKRWKKHDWLTFKHLPGITYFRIICTKRVEDVPNSSWENLFPVTNSGVETQ